MHEIDEILDFWIGEPAADADALKKKLQRWYMGGAALDQEIEKRFGALVERALAGELSDWAQTPRGRLALVLLLDQFTRNLFRGTPKAFAGDATAQRLAMEAFDAGIEREVGLDGRMFLIMPLLHAEDLALQERAVKQMAVHVADAPEALRPLYGMGIEQTHKYRDVIARFGRFPHRNEALGRTSTPEEVQFLAEWQGPPTGMRS